MKEIYLVEGNLLMFEHLDLAAKFVGFMILCNAAYWRKSCSTYTTEVSYYQYMLGLMPSVSIEKINKIVSRLIECEKENDDEYNSQGDEVA